MDWLDVVGLLIVGFALGVAFTVASLGGPPHWWRPLPVRGVSDLPPVELAIREEAQFGLYANQLAEARLLLGITPPEPPAPARPTRAIDVS